MDAHFITRVTSIQYVDSKDPCSVLLVRYSALDAFAAMLIANIALPWSSLPVTGDEFCYLGHAHLLYPWQGL